MEPGERAAELAGALTLATDLGAGVPPESALRTALLAAGIAKAARLPAADLADAYWAGLYRYLGCSVFAHETAQLGAGDDQGWLSAFEAVDPARVAEVLAAQLGKVGRGAGLRARGAALATFLSAPDTPKKLAQAHCAQAIALARKLGASDGALAALGDIYERWDGRGQPNARRGQAITLPARVLHLANALEIHLRVAGAGGALAMAAERRGRHFDPSLTDVVLASGPALLEPCQAASVWDAFLAAEPEPHRSLPAGGRRVLALAFAEYVDLKSPYTLGHSVGVARRCKAAAEQARLPPAQIDELEIAALLHDLGRVSVPNGIWDKRDPLSSAERERVRQHPYHTERILNAAAPWKALADLAAGHHERLDGTGYHRRIAASALPPSMRLLAAADVFQALGEPRPHRPALSPEAAARVLRDEVTAGRLDEEAVGWVLAAAGQGGAPPRTLPDGLTDREVEVLRLLARGLSNKEIGKALFVSPITAKNHVAHIYEKTGLATRAAAALYAVEKGLV
jgi:HD-GYP domain-containing protein (c-di-GMP phosphodiesterase class II)